MDQFTTAAATRPPPGPDERGSGGVGGGRSASILAVAALILSVPGQASAVDAGVWTELGKVQHLEARFDQVQTRAILRAPLTSSGTVSFSRPGTLAWVVEAPIRSTFRLDGAVATMEYPDLGKKERIDLAAVPDAGRLATSLLVWLQADAAAVDRDFVVTYGPTSARLVPRDQRLQALLASMELELVPSPWRVGGVVLLEPDGDRVELRFRDVRLDGRALE